MHLSIKLLVTYISNYIKMIKNKFYLSKVNHLELSQVLLSYFGQSDGDTRTQKYVKKDEPECFLEVLYDSYSRIVKITPSPKLNSERIKEISNMIKERLVKNQKPAIGQEVCYSVHKKVNGYFRYKDLFQIIPVPLFAPQPSFIAADFPFLLQFRYISCPDLMIDSIRKNRQFMEIISFLHFFSQGRLHGRSRYAEFSWVLKTDDPQNWTSEWKQLGYTYKGFSGKIDSFTPITNIPPIEREPYRNYYDWRKGGRLDSLTLPDNLEASLDRAFNLDEKERSKFFRACIWYYIAHTIWKISHSVSYLALITAAESLIRRIKEPICEECGRPIFQTTKEFNNFLRKYVPNINEMVEKYNFFGIRSGLSHGGKLFKRDIDPMSFMSTISFEEEMLQREMFGIAFTAIYNWLCSKKQKNYYLDSGAKLTPGQEGELLK